MAKGQTFNSWANDQLVAKRIANKFYQRIERWSTTPDGLGRVLMHKLLGNEMLVRTAVNRDQVFTFNGDLEEIAEGTEEAPIVSPAFFAERVTRVKIYSSGLQVTQEGYEDDRNMDRYIDRHIPMLGDFAQLHIERNFVDTFINRAFTYDKARDGFRLPGDTTPLVGTTHRAANGQLWANSFQTHQALSESAVYEAIATYGMMLDNSGNINPLRVTKWALIVPTSLYGTAVQIVRSTATLTAGANAGVRNRLADMNIVPVSSPYLTDETAWGIAPISGGDTDYGLDVIMRKAPTITKHVKEDPDLVKWRVKTRYTLSAGDARALFFTRAGQ